MRFILYPILLCVGFTANCQAQIFSELGFSLGRVFPYVSNEKALTTSIESGTTGAINIHTNFQNRAPLYFTLGTGLGVTHFSTHEQINARDNNLDRTITFGTVQISPGVQYKKSIFENLSWRLGLEVSGAFDIMENLPERNPILIPRLYTGIMMDNLFSIGVCYAKPINGYTTFDVKGFYWGNTYGVHTVSLDFRFRLPKVERERRTVSKREEFRLKREEFKRWREERRARRGK